MRVQAVTRIHKSGVRTCDGCGLWHPCFTVDLNGETTGAYCETCLTRTPFTIEQEVGIEYGKKDRRRTQKIAKKSEARTAEETGGRQTGYFPNSGDSRNSRYLFEDKTRVGGERKSFRLTQDIVLKGRDQALRAGLTPVFRVHLKDVTIGAMLWDDLLPLVSEKDDE